MFSMSSAIKKNTFYLLRGFGQDNSAVQNYLNYIFAVSELNL